jgi:hypothetical protein
LRDRETAAGRHRNAQHPQRAATQNHQQRKEPEMAKKGKEKDIKKDTERDK